MTDLANYLAVTGNLQCANCHSPQITFRELGPYVPHELVEILFRCFECEALSALEFSTDRPTHQPRIRYRTRP